MKKCIMLTIFMFPALFQLAVSDGAVYHTLIVRWIPESVIEVDDSGAVVWEKAGLNMPNSAKRLGNGNTLIAEAGHTEIGTDGRVTELNSSGTAVWTYRPSYTYYTAMDAERLANGNTLIADAVSNGGNWIHRVVEVNSAKNIVWQLTDSQISGGLRAHNDVERLANGNTLIADSYNNNFSPQGRVVEVNAAGSIVWEKTGLDRPLSAQRLINSNTLIADYYNDRVIEVNAAGVIVWQYDCYHPRDAKRLANGNTLMVLINTILEVDGSKNTVWEISVTNQVPIRVERITYPDNDGDGYASNVDCNDNDNTVYPGAPKLCDNKDNDCDGTVDNFTRITYCGLGQCAGNVGQQTCTGGSWSADTCNPLVGSTPEICDNQDNDCDGVVDDGLSRPTTCGVGECAGNTGQEACSAGSWVNDTCDPFAGATAEICDGKDNDCDGSVDDGNPGGGVACGSDVGMCQTGLTSCVSGQIICQGDVGPSIEICDYLDNDCDGTTDEGFNAGEDCSVGIGACKVFGTFVCSADGSHSVCDAIPGAPSNEICDGIDNDCDGEVDEGVQNVYYRDADGDSWGNGLDSCGMACVAPAGCVGNRDDCDDNDPAVGKCNTPPSPDPVTVTSEDGTAEVTFPNVSEGGETTVEIVGCSLDVPVGYTLNLANECYDIDTTATFDSSEGEKIKICLTYEMDDIPPGGINSLVILHCVAPSPCYPLDTFSHDFATDEKPGKYCALADHLSTFTLAVEPDSDYDGYGDSRDNCPGVFNPSQSDNDLDKIGNACDNCPDAYDPTNECKWCIGDFEEDGDVDGDDLSHLVDNPGQLDVATFAAHFGRTGCPIPMRPCSGGLYYDTGTAAWHYAVNVGGGIAVKFTPPSYPWTIDQASFWPWSSSQSLDFEIHVWDDDGPGVLPGSDLITPIFHSSSKTDQWEDVDFPKVTIFEGDFFIGWMQIGDQLFYNGSDDAPSSVGRSFIKGSDGVWKNFLDIPNGANMMIRQGCK